LWASSFGTMQADRGIVLRELPYVSPHVGDLVAARRRRLQEPVATGNWRDARSAVRYAHVVPHGKWQRVDKRASTSQAFEIAYVATLLPGGGRTFLINQFA